MKKRNVLLIVLCLCTLLLCSCNKYNKDINVYNTEVVTTTVYIKDLNKDSEIPSAEIESMTVTTTSEEEDDSFEIYYPYDSNFKYNMYAEDWSLIIDILGNQKVNDWFSDVYYVMTPNERKELPVTKLLIHYFDITKEDFIKYNYKNDSIPDYVIEGLFESDVNKMKEALVSPCALYHDGEVYTIYDLVEMSEDFVNEKITDEMINNLERKLIQDGIEVMSFN